VLEKIKIKFIFTLLNVKEISVSLKIKVLNYLKIKLDKLYFSLEA
jgi:hypothetical protein